MEQQTVSTICENACNQYVQEYCQRYKDYFGSYSIPPETDDISQLLRNETYLKYKLSEYENTVVEPCKMDIHSVTDEYLRDMQNQAEFDRRIIERNYAQEMEMKKRQHAILKEEAQAGISSEVQVVMDKRNQLLQYKEPLTGVFERYSIMPNEIHIDDSISIEDLCGLYDEAIDVCSKYFKVTKTKILEKLSIPVAELNESEGWVMLIAGAIGVTLLSPILLCAYAFSSIRSTSNIYMKLEQLKLASSLIHEGNFDRFVDKSKYKVDDIDITEIEARKEEELASIINIESLTDEINEYINTHTDVLYTKMNQAKESADGDRTNAILNIRASLSALSNIINELRNNAKKFGSEVFDHFYLNRTFQVGTIGGALPVTMELPMKNMIFLKESDTDLHMLPFMKVLLLNALMNVKEKHMYVTIVDNTNLGTHFSEFFDQRFSDIVTVDTSEAAQVIEKIRVEETERIKVLKTGDIDSLNKEHESIGKIPLDYKLYIITGDLYRLINDATFLALMRQSARFGIMIWVHGPDLNLADDCILYKDNPTLPDGELLQYSLDMSSDVLDVYATAYENSKDRGILYNENFADKYIPKDKWWTFSTKKGIDLHFGLVDGDPDKGYPITLGDAPVHGNMVGTTGAGKSVCINQLLASMITMYSPNELRLVMIDFKNVEFSFYADQETHSYSRLPHSKVLAGTKDGEYALSIFKFLCAEMDRRTAVFSDAGVKNLEEYRTKNPDSVMPRILLLIDEYQVMFTELPEKIVKQIMDSIRSLAKLARFCGCHMLFTSQSMKGTMDKDVQDQFALRVGLRCSADTALAVLGDDAPSKLKSKNGYLYTNEDGGNTKDKNRLWRTPFIPTDKLEYIISEINKMHNKPITAEFYDEKRMYTDSTLENWYIKYPDVWVDSHIMIIGEKTSYDVNKAPCYFQFSNDDGENLLIYGSSTVDTLNMTLTIVSNIKHHTDADIIMLSADRDSVHTIDMKSIVKTGFDKMVDPSYPFDESLDLLEKVIDGRKQKGRDELKPLYVFCMYYEKQTGYGRNSNSKVSNRFEAVMTDGPSVDVHFILVMKNKGDLMTTSFKKFNHKIVLACDSTMAFQLCEDDRPSKFPTNPKEGVFGLYTTLGVTMKFKVYQHTFANPIVSNEIFIA